MLLSLDGQEMALVVNEKHVVPFQQIDGAVCQKKRRSCLDGQQMSLTILGTH
jgi:hypothetical protein